jgi:hypothetical protein
MSTVSNPTEGIWGKRCSIHWYLPLQNTIQTSNPELITGRFADNHKIFLIFSCLCRLYYFTSHRFIMSFFFTKTN